MSSLSLKVRERLSSDESKLQIRYIEVLSETGEKLGLGVLHLLRDRKAWAQAFADGHRVS